MKIIHDCEEALKFKAYFYFKGRQVVASGREFNLRRDLRCVAKRTRKFYRKYTRSRIKADYPLFHWLIIG